MISMSFLFEQNNVASRAVEQQHVVRKPPVKKLSTTAKLIYHARRPKVVAQPNVS